MSDERPGRSSRRVIGLTRTVLHTTATGAVRRGLSLLWTVCIAALALCCVTDPACARAPAFTDIRSAWRSSEARLLDRHGALLHERRIDRNRRRLAWVSLPDMSPALVRAVIHAEDRRFYEHHGVDWRAMAAAAWSRLSTAHTRGASTLSMQLAALLDRHATGAPGRRSIREKIAQINAALELEHTWRKHEILEAYLNLTGFRGELQGLRAAARGLFGKEPAGLDDGEALVLAALLPSPNADAATVARRACALAETAHFDVECTTIRNRAAHLENSPQLAPLATLAPHLAQQLLDEPGSSVATTLDASLQRLTAETLRQQLRGLSHRNVRDGAAIVADNASGDILAYVGSGGPYSRSPHVDGARAARQAGSTLKPFLYALALERRYLTAASLLNDSPVSLETTSGLYIPQNYDRDFKGMVSVRMALAGSLNVPAVRSLSLVGVEPFRDYLNALGYAHIRRDGEYYGYSLALGSAEVTLREQVNAYRTLANRGKIGALRLRPGDAGTPERLLISAATAHVIADILADRSGRSITFGLDNPLTTHYWTAVKTGTSKDMRDNWCIGFSHRYTVGVWVGNFEGDAMHDVSGISGAAPVWQAIMDELHAGDSALNAPPLPPSGLVPNTIDFQPPIEPARREWFLAGTEARHIVLNDPAIRGPRIVAPPNGVMIALDPDIPPPHQAVVVIVAAPPPGALVKLDGTPLGAASAPHTWLPIPGKHRLTLIGAEGTVFDTIDFTVRRTPSSDRGSGPRERAP